MSSYIEILFKIIFLNFIKPINVTAGLIIALFFFLTGLKQK